MCCNLNKRELENIVSRQKLTVYICVAYSIIITPASMMSTDYSYVYMSIPNTNIPITII